MSTHAHSFESLSHPSVSTEAANIGVRAVDIRQCKSCGKVAVFVQIKNKWVSLVDDKEITEKDILLA